MTRKRKTKSKRRTKNSPRTLDSNPTDLEPKQNPMPTNLNQESHCQPHPEREKSPCSISSRASSPSNPSTSDSLPIQSQKRSKTNLTDEQEDEMASWLEANEILYNKKLNAYKDFKKKDSLWESKAASLGKDVKTLKTWYRSIRTRYTRLLHRKSGDGASELTERDRWILQNFAWLKVHIFEIKKKTTVSMKEKIASTKSTEDDSNLEKEFETETETDTISHQQLEPSSSVSSRKKAIQEEDRLLSNIVNSPWLSRRKYWRCWLLQRLRRERHLLTGQRK
ncbi:uncharacterized protein LOC134250165 [Saccostrea cucullata]|uniref:uncharacterized protein LOC134250165 n=1 Tax=Saccostrea cuccullata TaxID=36930 RepID=UPI002ED4A20C